MPEFLAASIHALRVRMKKLKAIVCLVNRAVPAASMEPLLRNIRRVKDALALQRDAEVLQKTAERFGIGHMAPEPPPDHAVPPRIGPSLSRLHRQVTALDLSVLRLKDLTKTHAESWRRARKAMKRSRASGESADFHRWRRRLKDYYFQSLAVCEHAKEAEHLRGLGKLAKLLGRVQDTVMLEDHLARTGATRAVKRRITSCRKEIQCDALEKGRKLLRQPLPPRKG
jgi:CHAD domain-containing protein